MRPASRLPGLAPLARVLKALADPTRLQIVALLSHGALCVCHLQAALGTPQSTTSRQIGVLRAAGIIEPRRTRRWIYYRLAAQKDGASAAQLRALVRVFRRSAQVRRALKAIPRDLAPACP